jgi:RNA polymerase sigma-70 factor (ECF subfamily)
MSEPDTVFGGAGRAFPTTAWGIVHGARRDGSPARRENLERLVAAYWKPVYGAIRQGWARTNEDAKDLTQEFFTTQVLDGVLLDRFDPARGSFRAFLKGALANFMGHAARDASRQKRGGGVRPLSLDLEDLDLEQVVPDARALSSDEVFDRAWARTVFAQALRLAEQRLREEGKPEVFEVFRRYDLEADDPGPSYAEVGRALGIDADTVKNHLTRARREFRRAAEDVVYDTVDSPEDLAAELKRLFGP